MTFILEKGATPPATDPHIVGVTLTAVKLLQRFHDVHLFDTKIRFKPPEGYYAELVAPESLYLVGWGLAGGVNPVVPAFDAPLSVALVPISQGALSPNQLIGKEIARIVLRPWVPFPFEIVENE
jgi:hypothetical protein